ncbi:Gldg family protein [Bradyrhizobium oligotrophicum]|uniref:Gldg family protein n=1 Tax=Bradyrhizobium TaxID=374 RepID=UPI0029162514|nr:Gldg family protein [Bradyrhizobium sp. SZCCHNR1015]
MHNVLRIARKELAVFFASPAAFIFMAAFLAVTLFLFFWVDRFFARNIADVRPLFEWMPVLMIFIVSAITMRMWSEERRAGTLEFLLTSPVAPLQLVLGKFLACLALVAIALALTLPLPITVSMIGRLDWGPVAGGYLAALALASAYISIGLFVSARSDNQVISLIVSTLICGAFYLLGSNTLTSLTGNEGGELLRQLGAGSRFESIARGVIDLRDLYYYLSIFGVFLVLNLYVLESLRWSSQGRAPQHRRWRMVAALTVANLVAVNLWLGQLPAARADLTAGHIYSISDETRSYLGQLQEPLLIRGYFSAQTHPLLAPLVPRLRDLLKEYEIAGQGKVRVEFVDPMQNAALEAEANKQYGIQPVPFQTSSKYQASVTNSYFNILVKYGDEYTTLGFRDLIEVKERGDGDSELDVNLRNPEYTITRAIKKVLNGYRGSGDVLAGLPQPVTLEAYISAKNLPEPLAKLKTALQELIKDYQSKTPGKLDAKIVDPDADGGQIAKTLQDEYGLEPLSVGLLNPKRFWFHLILKSGDKTEQIQLPEQLDKDGLKRNIDAELKRFTPGALRTVALYTPPAQQPMPQLGIPGSSGPSFDLLQQKLQENTLVDATQLKDGRVPERADILFVASPQQLDQKQLFAVDQFLMKGGTVIVAISPYQPSLRGNLDVTKTPSGLEDWLAFQGVKVGDSMVLDRQNASFPIPSERDVGGGIKVRQIRLMDYPFFADIRSDGLAQGAAPSAGTQQLTLSWASPLTIDADKVGKKRKIVDLIQSSPHSWTAKTTNVVPDFKAHPDTGFPPADKQGRQLLGAMMEGEFTSFFAGKPSPLAKDAAEPKPDAKADAKPDDAAKTAAADAKPSITGVISRSPESARLIVIGSGTFLSDDVLQLASSVDRTQYLAPLDFAQNLVDWSLEDRGLLALRSRGGQFSRTLAPMQSGGQMFWEYLNYALALAGLALVYIVRRALRLGAQRRYLNMLGIAEART